MYVCLKGRMGVGNGVSIIKYTGLFTFSIFSVMPSFTLSRKFSQRFRLLGKLVRQLRSCTHEKKDETMYVLKVTRNRGKHTEQWRAENTTNSNRIRLQLSTAGIAPSSSPVTIECHNHCATSCPSENCTRNIITPLNRLFKTQ